MLTNMFIFILIYIVTYIIYYFVIIRKYKKKNKRKRKKELKELVEISLLENYYKVDISKVNYNNLLNVCSMVSSFDISVLVFFLGFLKSGILQIVISLLIVIPLIFVSYYIVSLIYKRKDDKK